MTAICTNTVCSPVKPTSFGVTSTLRLISGAFEARSQRRALACLDTPRLKDLGLTFDQASAEAKRPFWDVPAHWKQ